MASDTPDALTEERAQSLFRDWWASCYPGIKASGHTVASHTAFAVWLSERELQTRGD